MAAFIAPIIGCCGPFVQCLIEPTKRHYSFLVSSKKHVDDMKAKMNLLEVTEQIVQEKLGEAERNTEAAPRPVRPWLEEVNKLREKQSNIKAATGYKTGKKAYRLRKDIEDLLDQEPKFDFTREQVPLSQKGSASRGPPNSAQITHAAEKGSTSTEPPTSARITHAAKKGSTSTEPPTSARISHAGIGSTSTGPSTSARISHAGIGSTSTGPSTSARISHAEIGSTSTGPSTSAQVPHGTKTGFKSRDLLFDDVLLSLNSNNESQQMVALCGIIGVGKTTMMEQLKKHVEDSKIFNTVVKVVLGESIDTIALQRDIAVYLTNKDLNESAKDARADRLRWIFEDTSQSGNKRILVIMDDLRKEVNLKDFGLSRPLPSGIKLLFTSPFRNVCNQMGVENSSIFSVPVLDDAEAEDLFFKTAGRRDDPRFEKIGKDIVKECGGLPKVIIIIANYLFSKIIEVWDETLSDLQEQGLQYRRLQEIHEDFVRIYKNLEREDDKAVFLLSGLFPHDFNIPIEDLMIYGWGLKLFTNVRNLAESRRRTIICVENLKSANLLSKSDHMGCVKMCNIVRAFVLSNFSDVKQASIVNHQNESLQHDAKNTYQRILLKCTSMTELPAHFDYPNLLLLILMDMDGLVKFPEDFYQRMKQLQVVSYAKSGIPLLPVTFEHSTRLRTLCLCSCPLMDDVSVLECLCNLETLSFAHCKIRRLPSAVGKLEKLKLLDLTGCFNLCIDETVFKNLCKLEELYMRACAGKPISFTDVNLSELEIISKSLSALELEFTENNKAQPKYVSFGKLKRFRISIGCELEPIEKHSFRNTLKLVTHRNELRNCQIDVLFEEVEELLLQVNGIECIKDVSMDHSFSNIRDLHVASCEDLTSLFTSEVANGLSKLERLRVSKCCNLRAVVDESSGVGDVTFQNLNFISLYDLPKMVCLSENVIYLPEMVELILDGLPNIKSIHCDNNNTSTMQSLLKNEVDTPKLERVKISNMENLEQIWSSNRNNVSMLRQIMVRKCDRLINLFPNNPLPLVKHLEELEVRECGFIKELFNIDFNNASGTGEYGSRLRSIRVEKIGNLEELWRISGVSNSDKSSFSGFEAVKIIEIRDCCNFKDIFTPTATNFKLGALTTYITRNIGKEINQEGITEPDNSIAYPSYILQNCNHLQHLELDNDNRVKEVVFEMDSQQPLLLPDFEVLRLSRLKEMRHVWKCDLQFHFQKLTQIYLGHCPNVKYMFSPLTLKFLSNLKSVTVESCEGIEEVISSRVDGNEENLSVPCLDTLKLRNLSRLRRIVGCGTINEQPLQSAQINGARFLLYQYPKHISVENCGALSSLVPRYALGQMIKLEELEIVKCKESKQVFESDTINKSTNHVDARSTNGAVDTTLTNPTLQNNTIFPKLSNLTCVYIYECGNLTHVFTFSVLQSLTQLKELKLKGCNAVKVVVKEEDGKSSEDVEFRCLQILILDDLPNLQGFFLGVNNFKWPSLDDVMINGCPQLTVFTSGQSTARKLKYIRTSFGKYSLEGGLNFHGTNKQTASTSSSNASISIEMSCSFHNLQEISLKSADAETVIPSYALQNLQKLEQVHLTECHKVKEVFEVALKGTDDNGVNESVGIPKLTHVKLYDLNDLQYLWRSNQLRVLKFQRLTSVHIHCCPSLEHVFTCSMVGSLVQLQDLHVSDCNKIEVIVKEEQEEKGEGGNAATKENEIILHCLKSLKLDKLSSLKGFCLSTELAFSWPLLDTLHINECRVLMDFTKGILSTPKLKVIHTTFGIYAPEDLNSFVKNKKEEGCEF